MRIGTNMSAVIANRYLSKSETLLQKSLERLSSGYKINSSKDDSSGMAISEKMKTQIKNLDRSTKNAADGISVTQTAEGAIAEIQSMLQRMNELAVQGASDTYTDDDRESIRSEIEALKMEIDRIADETEFNDTKLINGDVARRSYATVQTPPDANGVTSTVLTDAVRATYISTDVISGEYGIILNGDGTASFATDGEGNRIGFSETALLESANNKVKITDEDGFEMEFTINPDAAYTGEVVVELWDVGRMPIQVGANEGQTIEINIAEISVSALNLDNLDMSNREGCSNAITIINQAVERVTKIRAELGSYQNRLEYSVSSLESTEENMTAALSRITDVDMAEEMTTYTQYNVLQQAGVSMVAQANTLPEKVLQLLQ